MTVLLVEQNANIALEIADRAYGLETENIAPVFLCVYRFYSIVFIRIV